MTSKALSLVKIKSFEISDLASMAQQFSVYPLLTEAEEQALALRVAENGDRDAAQKLILSHMRYVISVAKKYIHFGIPARDIVQEGTVGLMKAVKNFRPEKGVRLVSYAVHWIKAEIHEYILKNWRLVKVATTKAQRKLFFNLNKFKSKIGWLQQEEREAIANKLNVSVRDVAQMELRLLEKEESIDVEYDDPSKPSLVETLADNSLSPELQLMHLQSKEYALQKMTSLLAALDERERTIIQKRWLTEEKSSLKELGEQLGISLERVRQIERSALLKLRQGLADAA